MNIVVFILACFLYIDTCFCSTSYNVIEIGSAHVMAINNLGEVVGHDEKGAFIWSSVRGKKYLTAPLMGKTWAVDINDQSQVLGVNQSGLSWLHEKGSARYLSTKGVLINNKGTVCVKNERDINDLGDTVGQIHNGDRGSQRASLNGKKILPIFSLAYGINNQKQIIGWMKIYHYGSVNYLADVKNIQLQAGSSIWTKRPEGIEIYNTPVHAFIWESNFFIDLGTLEGGLVSEALAVNDLGQVVGFSSTGETRNIRIGSPVIEVNVCHAFLWENNLMTDLNNLIKDKTMELKCATAINNNGQILAYGLKNNTICAVLLVPAE